MRITRIASPSQHRERSDHVVDKSMTPNRYDSNLKKVRTCRECGAKSDSSRFYPNITTHCAVCWAKSVKAKRDANLDEYRAKDRARSDQPQRVEARREYQLTITAERKSKYIRKNWAKYPEKRAANVLLGNGVARGIINKPSNCEICNAECSTPKSLHAHHEDYSKPFDVTWMCRTCHGMKHREENEKARRERATLATATE